MMEAMTLGAASAAERLVNRRKNGGEASHFNSNMLYYNITSLQTAVNSI